ncbi:MAG TPA: glycosyltransferase, partial [Polyangiaceae bacterium]|nr:glycosyltransferase [Polyangiaceae bacterium]
MRLRLAWIAPSFQLDEADVWSPGLTALAHRLAEEHEVTVYSLRSRGGRSRFRIGNVQVRAFPAGPPAGLRTVERIGPLIRAVSWLARDSRARPPDVIHALWATEPAVAGAIAARLVGRPLLVSSMGGEPASLPAIGFGGARTVAGRACLGTAVAAARILTSGSKWHAEVLRARIGSARAIAVTPLGIDIARYDPPTASPPRPLGGPLRLLAVGSLLPVKGHRLLVEALGLLRAGEGSELRGLRLRIVGEGPERRALEMLIGRLDLGDRIELAGQIDPRAMPAEYAAADLFVLSSHYESQCLALLEALASGLPVASTAVGLAPELLADGQAGELALAVTPEGLASALHALLLRREAWPALR